MAAAFSFVPMKETVYDTSTFFVPVVIEDDVTVTTGYGDQLKVRLGTVVDRLLLYDQTHFVTVIAVEIKVVHCVLRIQRMILNFQKYA